MKDYFLNYLFILQKESSRLADGPVGGVEVVHHVSVQADQQSGTVFQHPVGQIPQRQQLFAVELKSIKVVFRFKVGFVVSATDCVPTKEGRANARATVIQICH